MRKRYENNPRSWLGRFWRWHIGWCPGWKSYKKTLSEQERDALDAQIAQLDARRRP